MVKMHMDSVAYCDVLDEVVNFTTTVIFEECLGFNGITYDSAICLTHVKNRCPQYPRCSLEKEIRKHIILEQF